MKLRRIFAVFKKQMLDSAYNFGILLQFFLYPVMTAILIILQPNSSDALKVTMVCSMISMFTGMMPIITVKGIISEDRTSNVLRMLILSTVKPIEYLIGISAFMLFGAGISGLIFAFIAGFTGLSFFYTVLIILCGVATSILLGSALAIASKNPQASGFIIIVSLMNGMLPVFGTFNPSLYKITKYWYTSQIGECISDIGGNFFGNFPYRFAIIGANFVLFLVVFIISYKKNKLITK